MSIPGHIHWEEGLFLQPHHLQTMQRQHIEQRITDRRLMTPFPYGVVAADLSREELQNLLLRFDELEAVMPSGLHVKYPGNMELPPLDISQRFKASGEPIEVSLGVPLWYPTRGNSIDDTGDADWRVKRIFRLTEVERPDENTGENPQPVRMRRVNARLVLNGDDQTDLEVLPLMRILHAEGEDTGLAREDRGFIPPCLVIRGSRVLTSMVRDLANAVEASRRELTVQLSRGGFSIESIRGVQFEQMLRLQSLSRFAARLSQLIEPSGITPFQVCMELQMLLAELEALRPDVDPSGIPRYDHDNPYLAFSELDLRIKSMLRGAVAASFIKAPFEKRDGMFEATLQDDHFTLPNEYFLGIKTKEDPVALSRLVEDGDKFKLMPKSLAGKAIRGVKLVEDRHPPLQLPSAGDLHYFRLMRSDSERMWGRVAEERVLTAQWPNCEVVDWTLTLYMPVASGAST